MYIVTGGAGFIGSNIIRGLNNVGVDDILAVDNLKRSDKFTNLADCKISDYADKREFRDALEKDHFSFSNIDAILHQGACSDTLETDGQYMMDNNYAYSKILLEQALKNKIPFIYASSAAVYGRSSVFKEQPEHESPINIYGYSKYLFDQYVRKTLAQAESAVVGLRYFNVYGPRETHKGKMSSVALQFYQQLKSAQTIQLFEGTDERQDGEQKRDFIFVADAVNVNLFFLNAPSVKGIFNVGTGNGQSFNQIADCLIELEGRGEKTYIPFPESLRNKYQSFTQADISALRAVGYAASFLSVEEGVQLYYQYLNQTPLN